MKTATAVSGIVSEPPGSSQQASWQSSRTRELTDAVLQGLAGEVPSRPRGWHYVISIAAVGAYLLILPGLYVAFVVFSAWFVWHHLTLHWVWCRSPQGAVGFLAMTLVGVCWLVALIRPFCGPPLQRKCARRLCRAKQTRLYEFVERIFAAVGVEPPKYIEIDYEANASAGFGDRFWNLMTGRVTVLTIGLPLVAGLEVQQLAGVVAHECGHFRQRVAMRLSTVVRWVARWFAQAVCNCDNRDTWRDAGRKKFYFPLAFLLYVFTWITQRLLWLLLMTGRAAAAFLLRQMELDADRYEVRLVGADTFRRTALRMHELALAEETALDDMAQSFRDGRVADNYPALILAECEQLGQRFSDAAEASILAKTNWLDSHPSDAVRIRNALAEPCQGGFHETAPAQDLLNDFDGLCEQLTRDLNHMLFGEACQRVQVVALDEFLQRNNEELEDLFALKRLFAGSFSVLRGMWTPPRPESGVYVFERAIDILMRTSRMMSTHLEAFVDRATKFHRFDAMLRETIGELAVAHANSSAWRAPNPEPPIPEEQHREIRAALERLDGQMARFDSLFWARVAAALELLRSPIADEISDNARHLVQETKLMWQAAYSLHAVVPSFGQLEQQLVVLESLLEMAQSSGQETVDEQLDVTCQLVADELREVYGRLDSVVYPFELKPIRSICQHLFENAPADEQSVVAAAYGFVDRFPALYARVIGRLARTAETVETAVRQSAA